jgi:hypothetical protein
VTMGPSSGMPLSISFALSMMLISNVLRRVPQQNRVVE